MFGAAGGVQAAGDGAGFQTTGLTARCLTFAGRRSSSSFFPRPQRLLQSCEGKNLGRGWVWAHSEEQSGLKQ